MQSKFVTVLITVGISTSSFAHAQSMARATNHAASDKSAPSSAAIAAPEYLHALEDIKGAESRVKARKDKTKVSPHETRSLEHLNAAQYIIYKIEGKNVSHPIVADESPVSNIGRVHDAIAYLAKAKSDLSAPESNPKYKTMRTELIEEIQAAENELNSALKDYAKQK